VVSVARIETRYLRGNGRQTGYIAQHLDADGRVIAQDNVYGYQSEGIATGSTNRGSGHDNCSCRDCKDGGENSQTILFKAMLPDTAPGDTLRIVKCGEVVWERKGPVEPPTISSARAVLNKDGNLELTWRLGVKAKDETKAKKDETSVESKDKIDVWVRWTNDDGETWHALTVGLRGNSVTIDAEQLPSGQLRFELLANDGFHTVRKMTDVVTVPNKPPSVAILYPGTEARVYGDRLIHLWGSVSSFSGARIDPEAAQWFIDDKSVGKGLDLWVENPGEGRHSVRLQVTEAGLTGTATNEIEVQND